MEPYEFKVGPFLCKASVEWRAWVEVGIFFNDEDDDGLALHTFRYAPHYGPRIAKEYKYRGEVRTRTVTEDVPQSPERIKNFVRSEIKEMIGKLLSGKVADEDHSHSISSSIH